MLANHCKRFATDESGATMVEYGLLIAVLCLALVGTFTLVGNSLSLLFAGGAGSAANKIAAATATMN